MTIYCLSFERRTFLNLEKFRSRFASVNFDEVKNISYNVWNLNYKAFMTRRACVQLDVSMYIRYV